MALLAGLAMMLSGCGQGGGAGQGDEGGGADAGADPTPSSRSMKGGQVDTDERGPYDFGVGAWMHGDELVHATTTDLVAVDRRSGEERWRLEPPKVDGKSAEFCGASPTVVEGRVALAYGVGGEPEPGVRRHCTEVQLVDLASHQPVWSKSFVGGEAEADEFSLPQQKAYVEIVGDSVVVGYLRYLRAFDATGGELWFNRLVPPSGEPTGGNTCSLGDMSATDTEVVALSDCAQAPDSVLWIDPTSEKVVRRARLTDDAVGGELASGAIVSTDPTIFTLMRADRSRAYAVLDDSGKVERLIENPADSGPEQLDFSSKASPDAARSAYRIALGEDRLATVTLGNNMDTNELVLYDLATGEQRWRKGLDAGWRFQPIAVGADGVLAVAVNSQSAEVQIVRADESGNLDKLGQVRATPEAVTPVTSALLFEAEGRLQGADLSNRSDRTRTVLFGFGPIE